MSATSFPLFRAGNKNVGRKISQMWLSPTLPFEAHQPPLGLPTHTTGVLGQPTPEEVLTIRVQNVKSGLAIQAFDPRTGKEMGRETVVLSVIAGAGSMHTAVI